MKNTFVEPPMPPIIWGGLVALLVLLIVWSYKYPKVINGEITTSDVIAVSLGLAALVFGIAATQIARATFSTNLRQLAEMEKQTSLLEAQELLLRQIASRPDSTGNVTLFKLW